MDFGKFFIAKEVTIFRLAIISEARGMAFYKAAGYDTHVETKGSGPKEGDSKGRHDGVRIESIAALTKGGKQTYC